MKPPPNTLDGRASTGSPDYPRLLGIVGGLGPYSHVELERRLLEAVADAAGDQSYPPWIVSSLPATPDRTAALAGRGPSPAPWLVASLERLRAAGADFAVIACNTAHAFWDEVAPHVELPLLHLVDETVRCAHRELGWRRIGLLATDGTLKSGVYQSAAARAAAAREPGLEVVTLPGLADGDALQEELVMRSIYGPRAGEGRGRLGGGLKSGFVHASDTGRPYGESLTEAAARLAAAGVDGLVLGCTELSLALAGETVAGLPFLDPLRIAAREALRIARGERDLPPRCR